MPKGSQTTYQVDTSGIDLWNTSRFDTGQLAHELTYGGDWVTDDVVTTSPEAAWMFSPLGQAPGCRRLHPGKADLEWLEVVGALRYDSYKLDSDVGETSGDRLSPRITVGVSPLSRPASPDCRFTALMPKATVLPRCRKR